MRIFALGCIAAMAALPASASGPGLDVDLLPGHPLHLEATREAGVVMAIAITPHVPGSTDLVALCDELRTAAGLALDQGAGLPLEVIFVVPYKGMAIEGYYLPVDGAPGAERLIAGNAVARTALDDIVARAGIPADVLDEAGVEHEVSCELRRPAWLIRWEDVRPIETETPETVIARAYDRFLALHRVVLDHAGGHTRLAGR